MNSKIELRNTVPLAVRASVALALTLQGASSIAQYTITPITMSGGTSVAVSGLNTNGHVAGYYVASDSTYRSFFWANGVATDLGTLGGSLTIANGLNNLGQVIGYAFLTGDSQYHPFIWSGGSMHDLGTLGGLDASIVGINDAGQMAGFSYLSPISLSYRAVLATSSGLVSLGSLGGSYSSAYAINSSGQVAGESSLSGNFQYHAFLFSGGVMRDLGTFGGSQSSAFAINDAGLVTGHANLTGDSQTHAFLFDGTTLHNLGTLGGTYSCGYKINNAGQIVGESWLTGDVEAHACLYRAGTMLDLGTLGGANSSAWALNNSGNVVGVASDASGMDRAYLWKDGVMTDLNTLLPANSGWELTAAYFIDDYGHIAGTGLLQGEQIWFLMTMSSGQNHPPVANAGADQVLECNGGFALVSLNGSASTDPDGDTLNYEWVEGNSALGSGASFSTSLSAGVHLITLRVSDPQGLSAENSVIVTIRDTTPPAITCPEPLSVPVGVMCSAVVPDFLAALVASDNCTPASALVKTQIPAAGTSVGNGVHSVVVTVVDAAGLGTTCTTTFTVADVTPPVVQAPTEVTRPMETECQAAVPDFSLEIIAADNCTPTAQLNALQSPAAGSLLERGTHKVRITVTDAAGNATTKVVLLHVVDEIRPVFQSLTASPDVISPANKKLVPVTLSAIATDNCDPNPLSRIVSVTSSEPVDSTDIVITGDLTLLLRAEVVSKSTPRIYTATVSCTDASGNATYKTLQIQVAKNKNGVIETIEEAVTEVNSGKKK
jgi:probable HAF family extracellular repeat protein